MNGEPQLKIIDDILAAALTWIDIEFKSSSIEQSEPLLILLLLLLLLLLLTTDCIAVHTHTLLPYVTPDHAYV